MAGTWGPLTNQPTFSASTMLLLTDGTVLCQEVESPHWHKLTPDSSGNYVNGTWTALADGPNGPLYYASAVLRDGRVFVAGGEDNNGVEGVELLAAEIYDPVANKWTAIGVPAGWVRIGDAPSCVLPDGRVLLGSNADNKTAIYDPVANTWTATGTKNNASSSEETWTLLPEQTVLTCDCSGHPATEKYNVATGKWIVTGNTPSDLVEAASIEIGPAILLPDGRVFAIGATNHTALYTMGPISTNTGTWANGPTFAPQAANQVLGAKDAPACLMPNGRVLCTVSPVDGIKDNYNSPTYFFEYDPVANTLSAVSNPPTATGPSYAGRMLLLPSGQVLYSVGGSNVQVYTPDGSPDPFWKPRITSCPTHLQPGHTYTLSGQQINGLSQAVSYGDDAQMATNYPIVKITQAGKTYFCRTANHSTMSVNTGTVVHTTQFTVPSGPTIGAAQVTVIANGIPSDPFPVTIGVIKIIKEIKEVKEFKVEIKEIKEIEKNQKIEVEGLKQVVENKLKDSETIQQNLGDIFAVMQQLAARVDQHEQALAEQRAFIQPAERPDVGVVPPPAKKE